MVFYLLYYGQLDSFGAERLKLLGSEATKKNAVLCAGSHFSTSGSACNSRVFALPIARAVRYRFPQPRYQKRAIVS